ncbi:MAG: branched-chain amino acid ABC transporter permease [Hyphomicrobiaceae bacterium]
MPDRPKQSRVGAGAAAVAGRVADWVKDADIRGLLSKIRLRLERAPATSLDKERGQELDNRGAPKASETRIGPSGEALGRGLDALSGMARRVREAEPVTRMVEGFRAAPGISQPVARTMEWVRTAPRVPAPIARLLEHRYIKSLVGLVRGHALLVFFAGLCILPYLLSYSQQEIAVFLVINVLLVASYRLLTLTGEWSLGHVVMMGVGAYASALFAKKLGVPVPISMLIGACFAGLAAFALSYPLFRMKGFYFLIGSFAAGEIIRLVWKRFTFPFGGPKGIKRIDAFPDIKFGVVSIDFYEPVNYYFFCLLVVGVSLYILYRVERSRIGLTFHAIHWQDKLAESVGVDTFRYRMLAFVMASFFAGLAGALYAHYVGTINPNRFGVDQMVFVLVWAIVGGTATFYGPILGVVVLTVINEMVLRGLGLDTVRPMIYGAIPIAAVLFLPKGLESLVPQFRDWFRGSDGKARDAARPSVEVDGEQT